MFRVFVRNWYTRNPRYPRGLEPRPGRKRTLHRNVRTEEEARSICAHYNATHEPGRLSHKAEYEEQ